MLFVKKDLFYYQTKHAIKYLDAWSTFNYVLSVNKIIFSSMNSAYPSLIASFNNNINASNVNQVQT